MKTNQEIILELPVEARQRMYHAQWYKRSKMSPEQAHGMSVQDVPITPQMITRVLNSQWQRRNYPEEKDNYPRLERPVSEGLEDKDKKKLSGGQKGNQNARKYYEVDGYPVRQNNKGTHRRRSGGISFRNERKKIEITFD